jgi:hypothetical protein
MSSIAYENGFYWKTLWNLPQNAGLKSLRKNPNVLMSGDVVYIPDLTIKQEPGATEKKHKFCLKGVPEIFNMRLFDLEHKPRANLDYVIVIEGVSRRGKTDGNGQIKESIPPNAKSGKLIVAALPDRSGKPKKLVMILQLGNLNPISAVSGLKSRLTNLGFYSGPIDENLDARTQGALRSFQKKNGLPVTGVADDATNAQIQKLHGH